MSWIGNVRERHIRRFVALALFFAFLRLNSGNTIDGLYHVVLSARASFLDTVDGTLARDLGTSILPFGKTVSAMVLVSVLGLACGRVLRWIDYDARFIDSDADALRAENAKLFDSLRTANEQLKELNAVVVQVSKQTAALSLHQDRIVELRVELEKLTKKTRNAPKANKLSEDNSAPDLFTQPKPKSKTNDQRPPRRPTFPPKF